MPKKIVWVYEGEKGEPPISYIRKGQCTRCGDCCRKSWQYERSSDKEHLSDMPLAKNQSKANYLSLEVAEKWDGYWVWWRRLDAVPILGCAAFEEPNVCSCFMTDGWKELCRKWPIIPEELAEYPNCGFYFELAEGVL